MKYVIEIENEHAEAFEKFMEGKGRILEEANDFAYAVLKDTDFEDLASNRDEGDEGHILELNACYEEVRGRSPLIEEAVTEQQMTFNEHCMEDMDYCLENAFGNVASNFESEFGKPVSEITVDDIKMKYVA